MRPITLPILSRIQRMASSFSPDFDSYGLPQSAATVVIHVDSRLRHLPKPEVADVVAIAITNCSSGMAIFRLSLGLAGDGCGRFLGCEATCTASSTLGLALGDV